MCPTFLKKSKFSGITWEGKNIFILYTSEPLKLITYLTLWISLPHNEFWSNIKYWLNESKLRMIIKDGMNSKETSAFEKLFYWDFSEIWLHTESLSDCRKIMASELHRPQILAPLLTRLLNIFLLSCFIQVFTTITSTKILWGLSNYVYKPYSEELGTEQMLNKCWSLYILRLSQGEVLD